MLRLSHGLLRPVFALLLPLVCSVVSAQAQNAPDTKLGALTLSAPWTRATPGSAKVAGGYVRIANGGSTVDRLTGGTSTIAGRIEIHEMSLTDGVMRMRPLKDGLEIKPGASVELAPGGYHIMFMDLKQRLNQGESFKATLQFEKAGAVEVTFSVNSVGATSGAAEHKH
jgi:periplasmic copper chaperone A